MRTNGFARTALIGMATLAAGAGLLSAPAPADAAPQHIYGAIAISMRTGNTAYAINCKWVVQMDRSCGAVTQQPRTRRWGWAYGPTRRSAEVTAANHSGPGSRTVIWACTDR